MNTFLLELSFEQSPPWLHDFAHSNIINPVQKALLASLDYLTPSNIFCGITSRRLTFIIDGLLENFSYPSKTIKGPRENVPENILEKFCNKHNSPVQSAFTEDGFYWVVKPETSVKIEQFLSQIIADQIAKASSKLPKSLSHKGITWIRPISQIVCMLNNSVCEYISPFFEQLPNSSKTTVFAGSKPHSIEIQSAATYLENIGEYVDFDVSAKVETIVNALKPLQRSNPADVKTVKNLAFINETVQVNEFTLSNEFADLPEFILDEVILKNQYAFLENGGKRILFVTPNINPQKAIDGQKGVINSRLKDAKFFLEQDLNTPPENLLDKLRSISFHPKLGSIYDRLSAIKGVANDLARQLKISISEVEIETLIHLLKSDLGTLTVQEVPEVQGKMASFWAKSHNAEPKIVAALYEQYNHSYETHQGDLHPIAYLADNIQYILAMYQAGENPTSSRDPMGIRFRVKNIITYTTKNGLNVNFAEIINTHANEFAEPIESIFSSVIQNHYTEIYGAKIVNSLKQNRVANPIEFGNACKICQENMENIEKTAFSVKRIDSIFKKIGIKRLPQEDEISTVLLANNAEIAAEINEYIDGNMILCDDENQRQKHLEKLTDFAGRVKGLIDYSIYFG